MNIFAFTPRNMIEPKGISRSIERLLENELRSGENVIWSQQPCPAALVRKSSKNFLFGVVFFLFSVFWTYAASGGFDHSITTKAGGISWFPLLWGGMFIVVGAGMLLSPLLAYWDGLKTIYAVTDQRAIIIVARWKRTVFSFVDQQLVEIHRVEDNRGRGDIVFHRQARSGRRGDYYYDTGFVGIERVREVEDELRKLYEKTRKA